MTVSMPAASQGRSTEHSLAELIEELSARMEAGEPVELQAYLDAHPEHASELRRLYPALQLLADFSRSGEASVPPEGLEPAPALGMPLGDFHLLREIGRGGMGVVYEAEQLSLGRRVALKVLPFASTLDAKQLQRFKNEAQSAAHLHHPNIVQVFATGCERGVHYYAMQLIDGHTLAAFIAELRAQAQGEHKSAEVLTTLYQGALPIPVAQQAANRQRQPTGESAPDSRATAAAAAPLAMPPAALRETNPVAGMPTEGAVTQASFFQLAAWLGIQAAEALEHAHQLGIVHRDIKPANLLMDGRGNLWVADFGLAHCQSQAGLTMSGDLVGTLRYMSPEQALGQRLLVDHRTDIYSLGVTLYELLTLEPPFAGNDRQELLRQIAFEEPMPPRRLNKAIPTELETIVLKAMAKEPVERYASARDLADDLRYYLEDRPIRAKRTTWTQRLRKWQRRHRAAVATGIVSFILLLIAIAAALAISNVRITQEKNQKDEALQQKDEALQQSRANQQTATRRLKQTLQVIDRMMWADQYLAETPRMRPVHRRVKENVLEVYERLLAEAASDPEFRLEMAHTFSHVGSIRSSLGQLTEAEEAFRRGVALAKELVAESPDRPDYRRALALCRSSYTRCLEAQGSCSEERGREARAGLELWLGLVKESPANTDHQFYLGESQRQLASFLWDTGHAAEAEQLLHQALATHQKIATDSSDNPNYRSAVINEWCLLGKYLRLGRAPEAEGAYRNALKEARKLHDAFPQTFLARWWLAVVQGELGIRLCMRQQRGEGREFLAQAIAGWREILKDVPDDPAWAEEAGAAQMTLGSLLQENERPEEAEKAFRQALDGYEAAAQRASGAWQKRRCREQAIVCLGALGKLWRLQGRSQQAEEALRRSLALSQQLFDEFPQESEQRRRLAQSHDNLAWFLALRPDRQPHHAALALEHAQRAVALQPEYHDWWHTLGVAHCRLGHWKEALACIEKSRQLENNPRPPGAFDRFFESMAYSGLGDKANARRCYHEGVQWMQKNAPNHADLHRFRTEAAELLQIVEQKTQPKDAQDAKKPK